MSLEFGDWWQRIHVLGVDYFALIEPTFNVRITDLGENKSH
jgi:hypothetical protein